MQVVFNENMEMNDSDLSHMSSISSTTDTSLDDIDLTYHQRLVLRPVSTFNATSVEPAPSVDMRIGSEEKKPEETSHSSHSRISPLVKPTISTLPKPTYTLSMSLSQAQQMRKYRGSIPAESYSTQRLLSSNKIIRLPSQPVITQHPTYQPLTEPQYIPQIQNFRNSFPESYQVQRSYCQEPIFHPEPYSPRGSFSPEPIFHTPEPYSPRGSFSQEPIFSESLEEQYFSRGNSQTPMENNYFYRNHSGNQRIYL